MLTRLQHTILGMLSKDEPVEATADRICREGESFSPGIVCSMVTVDRTGRLRPLAGPSLPSQYSAALDGIPIGPEVGSCGSAAYLREPVAVTDISADHRWAPYRALAEPLGLKACWSSPIVGGDARVLGAFGFYYRDRRGPTPDEERVVRECTDLSAILLDRREVRAENFRLKYLDAFTGLGNRAGLEKAIAQAGGTSRTLGLLLFDIDRLRDVNDEHGYVMGDALIRGVAQRILRGAGPGRAFRTHGGEFAVLLEDPASIEIMPAIAERILAAMRYAVPCDGYPVRATLSCGGAILHPRPFAEPEILRWQAELALRQAKEAGRSGFVRFTENLATASRRRFQALHTTSRALSEDRVEAHYEPLARLATGEAIGVEALFRVRAPNGNLIPADELAPATQALRTAPQVTDRMLELVARDMRRWLDRGLRLQHVIVNLSRADIARDGLGERILATFSRHAVPLGQIMLGLAGTTGLHDDRRITGTIERWRAAGLRVALDGSGLAFAALTQLPRVPADLIRANGSLLARPSAGGRGEALLRGLTETAKGLGLTPLVRGVETRAQASELARLGFGLGQGALFGTPMPAAALEARLLNPATHRSPSLF